MNPSSSSGPRPAIAIRPVLPSDFTAIARLECDVFSVDGVSDLAFGAGRASSESVARRAASFGIPSEKYARPLFKAVLRRGGSSGKARAAVGVAAGAAAEDGGGGGNREGEGKGENKEEEEEEEIVGASQWLFDYSGGEMPKANPNKFGPNANPGLCEAIFGVAMNNLEMNMAGKRHAVLALLIVSIKHQRMGIGSSLLAHGLKIADAANLPVWLGGSPDGYPLYKKHGFVEDYINDVDLSKYGSTGSYRHISMIRPPQNTHPEIKEIVQIDSVNVSDLEAFVKIETEAYDDDAFRRVAFGDDWMNKQNVERRFGQLKTALEKDGNKMFKAVDLKTGEVIGYAHWEFIYGSRASSVQKSQEAQEKQPENTIQRSAIEERRIACRNALFDALGGFTKQHMTGKDYARLVHIVVSPAHHRRGIGSVLLDAFVADVDVAKLQAWLGSREGSHDLYKKFGFHDVDGASVEIDLAKYGGKEGEFKRHYCMLREAKI